MRPHLLGLDHVVILVRDLDVAAATYARMGFKLTPRGEHSIGTRNHCMMLEGNYIELLAVATPHPVTEYFSRFLAAGEGLGAVAYATDDAEQACRGLRSSGIAADAPVDFSRPVKLDEGGATADARFRIVQLPVATSPGGRSFLCQHFTPQWVWRAGDAQPASGVREVTALSIVADDPAACAAAYAAATGAQPLPTPLGVDLVIGRVTLSISTSAALRERIAGAELPGRDPPLLAALTLQVAERERFGRTLEQGGFLVRRLADGALVLGAAQAHGVALIFQ